MKYLKLIVSIVCIVLLLGACNKPTMDEDARKAAELSSLSTKRAMDSDWSSSEKFYKDAQTIIDKYRSTPQFEEFYSLYNTYLEARAYESLESQYADEDTALNN